MSAGMTDQELEAVAAIVRADIIYAEAHNEQHKLSGESPAFHGVYDFEAYKRLWNELVERGILHGEQLR